MRVVTAADRDRTGLCDAAFFAQLSARSTVEGFGWNDGDDAVIRQLQGATARNGRFWFSSSNGRSPGHLRVWDRGTTTVRSYRRLVGAEDLSHNPHPDRADLLWSLAEYPDKRVVVAVPRADWD
jgi:hypothetical protein